MNDDKKTYEAMFLLDAGNSDFHAASEPIRTVLERSEAETLAMKPWDDRRLAYEVQGRRRGLYVLTYFHADPSRITEIEHDCQLDERILRVLILQKDHVSESELEAETPAAVASRRTAEAAARREAADKAKPPADADEKRKDGPEARDDSAKAAARREDADKKKPPADADEKRKDEAPEARDDPAKAADEPSGEDKPAETATPDTDQPPPEDTKQDEPDDDS